MRILIAPGLKKKISGRSYKRKWDGLPNIRPRTNQNNAKIFTNSRKFDK
jgi:hypothetical protein